MNRLHISLTLAAVGAALLTGAFGGWIVDWARGNTAVAEIDHCYKYYGTMESQHFRCEGYWQVGPTDDAPSTHAVGGPVVGLTIDPDAKVLDRENPPGDLGYLVDAPRRLVFVTLMGDAAVVVPRSHLLLGPAGIAALFCCVIAHAVAARRRRVGNQLSTPWRSPSKDACPQSRK